jgi:hypothetical protein
MVAQLTQSRITGTPHFSSEFRYVLLFDNFFCYILLLVACAYSRLQDSNGGMPSIRRERKNSKTKSLSPSFMPLSNPINTSTSSLGSFSSEEDDLSDDSDDSDVFSSPDSPDSPIPVDSPVIQTRLPTTASFLPPQQQQFLQELQFQQHMQQAMLVNPFGDSNAQYGWEWSVPQQQINVHTTGASMPIAMNSMSVAVPTGIFSTEYHETSPVCIMFVFIFYDNIKKQVCTPRADGAVPHSSHTKPADSRAAVCLS